MRVIGQEGEELPVQTIYANGFKAALSSADAFVVLQRNGVDFVVLNMSFTVAKSLGEALTQMIANLESQSGRQIMNASEVSKAIEKGQHQAPKRV